MHIKNSVFAIIIGLGIVLGVSYVQAEWVAAPASPPSGNTPTPLNVSGNPQVKEGSLWLKSKDINGNVGTYGLVVENAPMKALGGFIIETRTNNPSDPETGRMWLRTDL